MTVGFFDGVHLGHRAVLGRTVEAARERGLPSVAVTFDRHPREVLTPGQEPRLLTTVDRKAALIEQTGVDTLLVLEFTEAFSRWPAERFVSDVLVGGLHTGHCVMGANFTFGHKAAGTVELLMERGPALGFTAERVELLEIDGRRVSSSSIRDALSRGDLEWPRVALGRRFVLDGTVVSGAGRGQGLGFPTANLRTGPRLLLPGRGIYAGRAVVGARATSRRSASGPTRPSGPNPCTSRRTCWTSTATSWGARSRSSSGRTCATRSGSTRPNSCRPPSARTSGGPATSFGTGERLRCHDPDHTRAADPILSRAADQRRRAGRARASGSLVATDDAHQDPEVPDHHGAPAFRRGHRFDRGADRRAQQADRRPHPAPEVPRQGPCVPAAS